MTDLKTTLAGLIDRLKTARTNVDTSDLPAIIAELEALTEGGEPTSDLGLNGDVEATDVAKTDTGNMPAGDAPVETPPAAVDAGATEA